jgi:hypothetical protein
LAFSNKSLVQWKVEDVALGQVKPIADRQPIGQKQIRTQHTQTQEEVFVAFETQGMNAIRWTLSKANVVARHPCNKQLVFAALRYD